MTETRPLANNSCCLETLCGEPWAPLPRRRVTRGEGGGCGAEDGLPPTSGAPWLSEGTQRGHRRLKP